MLLADSQQLALLRSQAQYSSEACVHDKMQRATAVCVTKAEQRILGSSPHNSMMVSNNAIV